MLSSGYCCYSRGGLTRLGGLVAAATSRTTGTGIARCGQCGNATATRLLAATSHVVPDTTATPLRHASSSAWTGATIPQQQQQHLQARQSQPGIPSTRSLSSSSTKDDESFMSRYSPLGWWRDRQEKKMEENFKTKINTMAQRDRWTLGDMHAELEEGVNSWKSKIPGASNTKEVQVAKKMHKAMSGLLQVVGKDATAERLENMTRTEKLKAAVQGETSAEEVNIIVQQFYSMDIMQRVVRQCRLEGKKVPDSAEAVQALVQREGRKMLNQTQKSMARKQQEKMMKKKAVRRR